MSAKYFIERWDLLHSGETKRYSVYGIGTDIKGNGAVVITNWGKTFPGFGLHALASTVAGQIQIKTSSYSVLYMDCERAVRKKEKKDYILLNDGKSERYQSDDLEAFVAKLIFMFGDGADTEKILFALGLDKERIKGASLGPIIIDDISTDVFANKKDLELSNPGEPDRGASWGSW